MFKSAAAIRYKSVLVLLLYTLLSTAECDNKTFPVSDSVGYCFKRWRNGQACYVTPPLLKFSDWVVEFRRPDYIGSFPIDYLKVNKPRQVKNCIFSVSDPTCFPNVKLGAVSKDAVQTLLDLNYADAISSRSFLNFASGVKPSNKTVFLAHRYGGHQFGDWAGQLGDGRAHLLGQYTNRRGLLSELQLKGSGKTPYSRRGDGKAVIRSSVREFLCSEALYGLGVPTSRALSLIVTDEPVIRDQFYDGNLQTERGAIVMRSAPTWFRIGSLEILSFEHEKENLKLIVDHIIQKFFNDDITNYEELKNIYNIAYDKIIPYITENSPQKYLRFFENVQNLTISMMVDWMSVGFAHGVCNTDNFSLLGMTIDFGPFGFLDSYDPNFIPNTSDDGGRYSINNQPNVAKANMAYLLQALSPLLRKDDKLKVEKILDQFNSIYQDMLMEKFRKKLGLASEENEDAELVGGLLYLMEQTKADFTMTFYELTHLNDKQLQNIDIISPSMWALTSLKQHKSFKDWIKYYNKRLKLNPANFDRKNMMKNHNPRYILRNWIAESAIQKAEENDFSEIDIILEILQDPFKVNDDAERRGFANRPPSWSKNLRVSCSS